jgi:hypothetical protein
MHKGITGFAHIIAYPFRLFRSDTGRVHSLPLTRNELHSQQS